MSIRESILHLHSPTEPTNVTIGDEWFDSSVNKLYKRVAVGGTAVAWREVQLTANAFGSTNSNYELTGALTISGSIDTNNIASPMGGWRGAGTNLVLKGDSTGRSGILFDSEKNGTNINEPTDYGFIQFHPSGVDSSSGETNRLVIGVANDLDDMIVLQTPSSTSLKASFLNASSGTSMPLYTIWHEGNSFQLSASIRANTVVTGGGTITVDGSGNILWSTRFIVNASGRGALFSTNGYFDINCPTSGTITGVGGASNKTATAAGIPLAPWEALYYILPVTSNSAWIPANFRVIANSADVEVPHTWIQICHRNGDDGVFYFPQGIKLKLNQSNAYLATIASASTITPTANVTDMYQVTAQAVSATIAAPSGTPFDGQKLILRIKDNGTAQSLTWTTSSGAYRAVGLTLPTTTVLGKVLYIACIYNSQDTFWDVIATAQL